MIDILEDILQAQNNEALYSSFDKCRSGELTKEDFKQKMQEYIDKKIVNYCACRDLSKEQRYSFIKTIYNLFNKGIDSDSYFPDYTQDIRDILQLIVVYRNV